MSISVPCAPTRRERLRAWIDEGMEIKRQQEKATADTPKNSEKMDIQKRNRE